MVVSFLQVAHNKQEASTKTFRNASAGKKSGFFFAETRVLLSLLGKHMENSDRTMEQLELSEEEKEELLTVAYRSISHGLRNKEPLAVDLSDHSERLGLQRASFVTLRIEEKLRGCIGVVAAFRPLVVDVAENAYAAAFRDSRFSELTDAEFDHIDAHISILSAPQPLACRNQADLVSQLQVGVHGLILEDGDKMASFLPSMWEELPDPEEFVLHLKKKGGMKPNQWSKNMKVQVYTTESVP